MTWKRTRRVLLALALVLAVLATGAAVVSADAWPTRHAVADTGGPGT